MIASTFTVKPLSTQRKFGKVIVMDCRVSTLRLVKKEQAKVISISSQLKKKVG